MGLGWAIATTLTVAEPRFENNAGQTYLPLWWQFSTCKMLKYSLEMSLVRQDMDEILHVAFAFRKRQLSTAIGGDGLFSGTSVIERDLAFRNVRRRCIYMMLNWRVHQCQLTIKGCPSSGQIQPMLSQLTPSTLLSVPRVFLHQS